jgi:hypothetical protein
MKRKLAQPTKLTPLRPEARVAVRAARCRASSTGATRTTPKRSWTKALAASIPRRLCAKARLSTTP